MQKAKSGYLIYIHGKTGGRYVSHLSQDRSGKVSLTLATLVSEAKHYKSASAAKKDAQAIADGLRYMVSVVASAQNPYRKNPAPGMAERSARIHRYRKPLVAALKKAIREGDIKKEWDARQKIRKLDYFMYAPRKGGMRLGRK